MNAVVLSPPQSKEISGHIGSFVKAIKPAIAKTTGELDDPDKVGCECSVSN